MFTNPPTIDIELVVDDVTASGFIALQVHSIGKPEEANKKMMTILQTKFPLHFPNDDSNK